jgi:hypothetical protein
MHGRHAWTERLPDGRKREVRAVKFGGDWKLSHKIRGDEEWVTPKKPDVADLKRLREILTLKYNRRRASFEDIKAVEQMIGELGG